MDTELGCHVRDIIHESIVACGLVQPVTVGLMVYNPVLLHDLLSISGALLETET